MKWYLPTLVAMLLGWSGCSQVNGTGDLVNELFAPTRPPAEADVVVPTEVPTRDAAPKHEPVEKPARAHADSGDGWATHAATAPSFTFDIGPTGWLLRGPDDKVVADLRPELRLSVRPQASVVETDSIDVLRGHAVSFGRPTMKRLPGESWTLSAQAHWYEHAYTLVISGSRGDPRIHMRLEATNASRSVVLREALEFETPQLEKALMVDRAYRVTPVDEPMTVGSLSPRILFLGQGRDSTTVLGIDGIQSLRASPLSKGRRLIEVELENAANHPFRHYIDCVSNAKQKVERRYLLGDQRPARTTRVAELDWVAGDVDAIRVGRFPEGYESAIVFTDHADQSNADKLEAFAFGSSGALAAGQVGDGHPGFVNAGLRYTKTVFAEQVEGYDRQLEDPDYRRVLDTLVGLGNEVGLHSATGGRDALDMTARLLGEFRRSYSGKTWVDHQPNTNCEAISNRGARPESPWFILDQLTDAGFRYVWSVDDLRLGRGSLNLLRPERPDERRPILYQHSPLYDPAQTDIWLFSSTWLFIDCDRLYSWFSPKALDRFADEKGLLIGHTYLDTSRRKFASKSLLAHMGAKFRLRPEAHDVFERLGEYQRQMRILVAPMERVAGHLLDAMGVKVAYLPDGRAELLSEVAIDAVTVILPMSDASLRVDDGEPLGTRTVAGTTMSWFDLEAGVPRVVEVLGRAGTRQRLMQPARVRVTCRACRDHTSTR